jgi:hypothetical protein
MAQYKINCITEIHIMYKDLYIVDDIKIRRFGWADHIIRMKDQWISKKFLVGNFITQDQ